MNDATREIAGIMWPESTGGQTGANIEIAGFPGGGDAPYFTTQMMGSPLYGMSSAPQIPPPRSTYRHGDLRRALLEAGVELARAGGPEAVVLREATRRAGVAPNAAYRHFENRQALLYAVRSVALAAVARAMAMQPTMTSRRLSA